MGGEDQRNGEDRMSGGDTGAGERDRARTGTVARLGG